MSSFWWLFIWTESFDNHSSLACIIHWRHKLSCYEPLQIIVATPGRLLDHIENRSGFSMRLMGLKVLILDEADRLLDLGFRKDIEKIVDCVPRQRQSLLFSATIPKEVILSLCAILFFHPSSFFYVKLYACAWKQVKLQLLQVRRVSQLVLKRDHIFIDTVGLGGLETHAKVWIEFRGHFWIMVAFSEIHFECAWRCRQPVDPRSSLWDSSPQRYLVYLGLALVDPWDIEDNLILMCNN